MRCGARAEIARLTAKDISSRKPRDSDGHESMLAAFTL